MRFAVCLVVSAVLLAQSKPETRTPEECAAVSRFNSLARAEYRGMKEAELEPECPTTQVVVPRSVCYPGYVVPDPSMGKPVFCLFQDKGGYWTVVKPLPKKASAKKR